eukprot:TRINITY_DN67994_c0_g1_i1.p1 TRINITY_DN67994_c0_g1~~TRINITY_DN67994_c0_g1_i1.p1  ORF type:complete len:168 (-),score=22.75 TRINITY_DN67994_c0_g1_i1:84-587(-)
MLLKKETYDEKLQKVKDSPAELAKAAAAWFSRDANDDVFLSSATHQPMVSAFEFQLSQVIEPAVVQSSSGGIKLGVLLAGDSMIVPWFPSGAGVNSGVVRSALRWKRVQPLPLIMLYVVASERTNPFQEVGDLTSVIETLKTKMDEQMNNAMTSIEKRYGYKVQQMS